MIAVLAMIAAACGGDGEPSADGTGTGGGGGGTNYVLGGTTGILQTPFGDAAAPMFEDPPGCYLHRQAGFIAGNFPEDAALGEDYDLKFLPPMENDVGNGALFQGDTIAVHTNNAAAGEFVNFVLSPEGQAAWFSNEGAGKLSVRTDFSAGDYPTDALRTQGEIFKSADFARNDGSDLMPGEVGSGAFWTEMVAWVNGSQDLDTTLQNIDAAWPEGAGPIEDPGGGGGEASEADTISLLHGIKGEGEQAALQGMIDAFEQASGKTVEVEFSPQFETVIVTRVQGGNPPDVALYPQPALLKATVSEGNATPLEDVGVDVSGLEEALVSGMIETGTFGGTTYGVVTGLNIKSLLWWAADDLESEGYQPPETWQDMLDLTQEISQTGTPAWCIGIESGDSTGWVATDWIEDIMLRLHGPDVYDQWVNHEIPFDSPEVKAAFEELEKIWMGSTG